MRESWHGMLRSGFITESYYGSLSGTRILIRPRNITLTDLLNATSPDDGLEERVEQTQSSEGLCNAQ